MPIEALNSSDIIPVNLDSHAHEQGHVHAQKGPENILTSHLWSTLRSAQAASEATAEL